MVMSFTASSKEQKININRHIQQRLHGTLAQKLALSYSGSYAAAGTNKGLMDSAVHGIYTLLYTYLTTLFLGFQLSESEKFDTPQNVWVLNVRFAGPNSTPLRSISFCLPCIFMVAAF